MQEYSIVIAQAAKADLRNIYQYVKEISSAYDAEHVIRHLAEKINSFNFFPERTEPFARDQHGRPLRATVSGRYRVIYIVKRETHEVIIVRVVSVAQDFKEL